MGSVMKSVPKPVLPAETSQMIDDDCGGASSRASQVVSISFEFVVRPVKCNALDRSNVTKP